MSAVTEALERLSTYFGHSSFREGQEDVIQTILDGRDSLVVMPTGTGKSVCYQLPAMMLGGITIVVSPLVALMKDQVDSLTAKEIPATFINSTLSPRETAQRLQGVRNGLYKLVYAAPERFRSEQFVSAAIAAGVSLFAVDEAHCISHWGHDFRPDYLTLKEAVEALGRPPVVALTATATRRVREDIAALLGLRNPAVFVTGFDRPNLNLSVVQIGGEKQKLEALKALLTRTAGSGIIYTATRRSVEQVTSRLKIAGFAVEAYHAGLTEIERTVVQDRFMKGDLKAIVATNAFGMGIDKQDIRFVVHYHVPGSIEAYYQEIGRAGRGAGRADCVLLFNYADTRLQRLFIEGGNPSPEVVRQVYDTLVASDSDVETPTAAEIARRIGASGEMTVRSALNVLEKAGHIERGDRMDGPAVVTMKIPAGAAIEAFPETAIEGIVLRHLVFQHSAADKESIDVDEQSIGDELGLSGLRIRDALSRLASLGVISRRRPESNRRISLIGNADVNGLNIDAEALSRRLSSEQQKLRSMLEYCYYRRCLREYLLRYFGEGKVVRECGNCSSCIPASTADFAAHRPASGDGVLSINTGASRGAGRTSLGGSDLGRKRTESRPIRSSESRAGSHVTFDNLPAGTQAPEAPGVKSSFDDDALENAATSIEILKGVSRLDGRFGKGTIAAFLNGSESGEVSRHSLNRLSGYGVLKGVAPSEINTSIRNLAQLGLIVIRTDGYPTVRITDRGREVLERRSKDTGPPAGGRKE